MKRFDTADFAHLAQALAILDKSLEIGITQKLRSAPVLSQEEVAVRFASYISGLEFQNFVTY